MDLTGPLLLCLDSVVCAKQKSITDSSWIGHQFITSELPGQQSKAGTHFKLGQLRLYTASSAHIQI